MTAWTAFTVFVAVFAILVVFLAHVSQEFITDTGTDTIAADSAVHRSPDTQRAPGDVEAEPGGRSGETSGETIASGEIIDGDSPRRDPREVQYGVPGQGINDRDDRPVSHVRPGTSSEQRVDSPSNSVGRETTVRPNLSTTALLANVAVSHGLFFLILSGAAYLANIPVRAFGITRGTVTGDLILLGIGGGAVLYAANEIGAAFGKRHGFAGSEALRELLAPTTGPGWFALLFGVLPLIALFEEALFRGAMIGVVSAGFDLSPWLLAVVSSIVFGFGHGAQGRIGIVVTAVLGLALAAVYIASGSLLVVVVAHYVINVLEFLVHEWLGWEPLGGWYTKS